MSCKKILYTGGQKSGKTALALRHICKIATKKPVYIATYDNQYDDKNMQSRIDAHKLQRKNKFDTIEEPYDLLKVIKPDGNYIVDCLSMWIFNNIDKKEKYFKKYINKLMGIDANIVFVLNDVNSGIIPIDKLSRKFIDITGIVGQIVSKQSHKVYSVKYGIKTRLK